MHISMPHLNLSQLIMNVMERHGEGIGPRRLAQSLGASAEHIRERLRTLTELGLIQAHEAIGQWDTVRYTVVGVG